jgi:predicted amidohydrolase
VQVSVCQFAPAADVPANLSRIAKLARQASASGAALAVFPEAAMYPCMSPADELAAAAEDLDGPFVTELAAVARSTGMVLVVGMYERRTEGKPYNTVVAVGPEGLLARHRKFLVYDAFGFRESDFVEVADPRADLFAVGELRVGMITCYEVRFPECARSLVDAGADLLVVSSAWPIGQGKEDHFTTLVRARALENTVYVAAAGDCSTAMVGRSHIIDPLGYQLAGLANEPGHAGADIDAGRLARARRTLPVLEQRLRHLGSTPPAVRTHRLDRPSLEVSP